MILKAKTRDELIDELLNAREARDYAAAKCVGMLAILKDKLPLEQWMKNAVASGELPARYLPYFFGAGEGSGVPVLGGYTIDEALKSWSEADNMVSGILEELDGTE